MRKRASKTARN